MDGEIITVNRRIHQWKLLSKNIINHLPQPTSLPPTITNSNTRLDHEQKNKNEEDRVVVDDPFDCSDAIIPPSTQLIHNVLQEYVKEWKELDSRVIMPSKEEEGDDDDDDDDDDGGGGDNDDKDDEDDNRKRHHNARPKYIDDSHNNHDGNDNHDQQVSREEDDNDNNDDDGGNANRQIEGGDYAGLSWGWHANRIRLPDFFDYTNKRGPPQISKNKKGRKKRRRQVVSLDDPTKLLDYEHELWNLFNNVPLAESIEQEYTGIIYNNNNNHSSNNNTYAVPTTICCQETMKVSREIENGLKEYTRLDGHLLNRLRKKGRHHWPRINIPTNKSNRDKRLESNSYFVTNGLGNICGATIRIECWRRQLKRGSGCDSNRCEIELIESQTLLDLHNVLVHCSQDDLFTYGMQKETGSSIETKMKHNNNEKDSPRLVEHSPFGGYFFIEDTFYINGDVDYVSPIMKWLDEEVTDCPNLKKDSKKKDNTENSNNKKKRKYTKAALPPIKCRKEYLGIKRDVQLKVVSMKDAKLSDIPFRLACRYVHVFNGDCESALFFSDVCMRMSNENVKESHYPLIHDIFTSPTSASTIQESSVCQGCNRGSAAVMTLNDELTDGGPTLLCSLCYRKLHYDNDGNLLYNNFEVVPLSVLQSLRDLSVGNDKVDAIF